MKILLAAVAAFVLMLACMSPATAVIAWPDQTPAIINLPAWNGPSSDRVEQTDRYVEPTSVRHRDNRFESETEKKGKIYLLSLHYWSDELYMTLNEIKVMKGYAPDYLSGGDWYFQLINHKQQVLEEEYFSFTNILCADYVDDGHWSGGCEAQEETDLVLEIPWHRNAWAITVYDPQGFVRFGPYDVSGMH